MECWHDVSFLCYGFSVANLVTFLAGLEGLFKCQFLGGGDAETVGGFDVDLFCGIGASVCRVVRDKPFIGGFISLSLVFRTIYGDEHIGVVCEVDTLLLGPCVSS